MTGGRTMVGRADEARISRANVLLPMRWVLSYVEPPAHFAFRDNFGVWRHVHDTDGDLVEHQHPGTDIEAPIGTRIFAPRAGRVLASTAHDSPNRTMGHFVQWQDADEPRIDYVVMHMRNAPDDFPPGARVGAGQTLGVIGTTGRSNGPHLHIGMRLDGRFVNAYPSLAAAFIQDDQASAVEGVRRFVGQLERGFIGPESLPAIQNQNFWNALNERAAREDRAASSFAWPQVVLDEYDEGSETRRQLQRARELYQDAARKWVAAYRICRDRGEREHAEAIVRAMELSGARMRDFVRNLANIASRTFLENLAHGADDIAAAASAVYDDVTGIASDVGTGLGIGVGAVAVLVLLMMARR